MGVVVGAYKMMCVFMGLFICLINIIGVNQLYSQPEFLIPKSLLSFFDF